VAITASITMTRLPFAARPQFGDPHPSGIVAGRIALTGDASGGTVTAVFQVEAGLIYRLEHLTAFRADSIADEANAIFIHRSLQDFMGLGSQGMDFNYGLDTHLGGTFIAYSLSAIDQQQQRRVWMGAIHELRSVLTTIMQMTIATNTNTVSYGFQFVCSYWRPEALYLPGFWSALWEAPLLESAVQGALRA